MRVRGDQEDDEEADARVRLRDDELDDREDHEIDERDQRVEHDGRVSAAGEHDRERPRDRDGAAQDEERGAIRHVEDEEGHERGDGDREPQRAEPGDREWRLDRNAGELHKVHLT